MYNFALLDFHVKRQWLTSFSNSMSNKTTLDSITFINECLTIDKNTS